MRSSSFGKIIYGVISGVKFCTDVLTLLKKRRHRYKDFTNDPNFKSHTDYAERMRNEFKRAEEIRIETDKREAEQGRKLILTLIATISAGYLTALIYQLTNHQIDDKNRSIFGQIGTVRII